MYNNVCNAENANDTTADFSLGIFSWNSTLGLNVMLEQVLRPISVFHI